MKPRLLDLFCGAGGCSMGYSRAGFDVVGVDLNPMPRYRKHARKTISIFGNAGAARDTAEESRRRKTITVTGSHGDAGLSIARQAKRPHTDGVWGNAGGQSKRDGLLYFSTAEHNEAMGIDWMKGGEISQAIPPAYTEFIGRQLIEYLAKSIGHGRLPNGAI